MTQLQIYGFHCAECECDWRFPQWQNEQLAWALAKDHEVRLHRMAHPDGERLRAYRVRWILTKPHADSERRARWVPQTHVAAAQAFIRGMLLGRVLALRELVPDTDATSVISADVRVALVRAVRALDEWQNGKENA